MELTVGTVLEGKVKSITNFGAFIALPENKTGMVHISEVANAYVSDIRQHLTEGQDVKVVVIGNDSGKINLSVSPVRTTAPVRAAVSAATTRATPAHPVRTIPRARATAPSVLHLSSLLPPRPQTSSSRRS